jgi:hypothetical protein
MSVSVYIGYQTELHIYPTCLNCCATHGSVCTCIQSGPKNWQQRDSSLSAPHKQTLSTTCDPSSLAVDHSSYNPHNTELHVPESLQLLKKSAAATHAALL